jgi:hypothetical protein
MGGFNVNHEMMYDLVWDNPRGGEDDRKLLARKGWN